MNWLSAVKKAVGFRKIGVNWTWMVGWPDAGSDICHAPGIRNGICGAERRLHGTGISIFVNGIEIRPHRFVEKEK